MQTAIYFVAAICYIAPSMEPAPTSTDYVERIVQPARAFGFPDWYISRLERFQPATKDQTIVT